MFEMFGTYGSEEKEERLIMAMANFAAHAKKALWKY